MILLLPIGEVKVATIPTVYGIEMHFAPEQNQDVIDSVAIVFTVYGMRRRVRDSRGAKRR